MRTTVKTLLILCLAVLMSLVSCAEIGTQSDETDATKITEQTTDRQTEKQTEKSTEKNTEKSTEKSTEQSTEQSTEKDTTDPEDDKFWTNNY